MCGLGDHLLPRDGVIPVACKGAAKPAQALAPQATAAAAAPEPPAAASDPEPSRGPNAKFAHLEVVGRGERLAGPQRERRERRDVLCVRLLEGKPSLWRE